MLAFFRFYFKQAWGRSMKSLFSKVIFFVVCFLAVSYSHSVKQSSVQSPDFQILLEWFAGEFNNFEQYTTDTYAKEKLAKEIVPHKHVHSIFAPISLDILGKHVFHVQQTNGADLNQIYRIRLYVFSENTENGDFEMRIFKYPSSKEYFDVHKFPQKLSSLTIEQLEDTGVVILWNKDGKKFKAGAKGGHFTFYSEFFKQKITVKDDITLSKDGIWILDDIYGEDGKLLMGRSDGIPRKLKRCKFYSGWAAIKQETKDSDGESKSKWIGYRGITLHNQGQRVKLVDGEGNQADYQVSLSQLTYAGNRTKVLKLGVHEQDQKKTKYYIWGSPKARRLGLNVGWFQTGFTLSVGQRFGN